MGTFATKKILQGNPSLIPVIAEQIKTEFAAEQFEVQIDNLLSVVLIFLYQRAVYLKLYLV